MWRSLEILEEKEEEKIGGNIIRQFTRLFFLRIRCGHFFLFPYFIFRKKLKDWREIIRNKIKKRCRKSGEAIRFLFGVYLSLYFSRLGSFKSTRGILSRGQCKKHHHPSWPNQREHDSLFSIHTGSIPALAEDPQRRLFPPFVALDRFLSYLFVIDPFPLFVDCLEC